MGYKDKDKQRAYQLAWMQRRRQEYIDSQKSVCAHCGRSDLPFEVDHIDPSTKINHKIWSWARNRREAELAKCQLLCQDCHWKKTGKENYTKVHGITMYRHGCKCDVCKEAKRVENARRYMQ